VAGSEVPKRYTVQRNAVGKGEFFIKKENSKQIIQLRIILRPLVPFVIQ
jgi:hypothetical protein